MKFDKLVKVILEGDFDPNYDTNPFFLSKKEIENLSRKTAKKLSEEDKSKRLFKIKYDRETYETHARSATEAIGNVGQRISASLGKIKPHAIIAKVRDNGKVTDTKWDYTY